MADVSLEQLNIQIPETQKGKAKVKRGTGHEADRVSKRLSGFDYEKSSVWDTLSSKFGSRISHAELKSIASVICCYTGLKVDRDASRDNRVLIKWYEENWSKIQPFLPKIHLRDDNDVEIVG